MNAKTCIHFNGIQNAACLAGVNYDKFRDSGALILPCYPRWLDADKEAKACELFVLPTPEQIAADEAEYAEHMKKMELALAVARKWRVKPKPAVSRAEVVECPCCQGRLHLSQSSYNGHVHGRCETEGCASWME